MAHPEYRQMAITIMRLMQQCETCAEHIDDDNLRDAHAELHAAMVEGIQMPLIAALVGDTAPFMPLSGGGPKPPVAS